MTQPRWTSRPFPLVQTMLGVAVALCGVLLAAWLWGLVARTGLLMDDAARLTGWILLASLASLAPIHRLTRYGPMTMVAGVAMGAMARFGLTVIGVIVALKWAESAPRAVVLLAAAQYLAMLTVETTMVAGYMASASADSRSSDDAEVAKEAGDPAPADWSPRATV